MKEKSAIVKMFKFLWLLSAALVVSSLELNYECEADCRAIIGAEPKNGGVGCHWTLQRIIRQLRRWGESNYQFPSFLRFLEVLDLCISN